MPTPDSEHVVGDKKFEKFGETVYEVKEKKPTPSIHRREITPWILKQRRQAYLDAAAELDAVLVEVYPGVAWDDIEEPTE